MPSQINQNYPPNVQQPVSKEDMIELFATMAEEINHGGFFRLRDPRNNSFATGSVERTAQDKARDFPDVRDWGALGNDGDDTSALQTAFNEAAALTPVGGALYVPDGVYTIGSTLAYPSRLNLIGESYGAVIKLGDGADCVMLRGTDPAAELQQIVGPLSFDGNGANQPTQDGSLHCIELGVNSTDQAIASASLYGLGSAKLYLHGLFIAHAAGDGIKVSGAGGGNMSNITVRSVLGNGMNLEAPAIGVDSLDVRRCGRNGVRSSGARNRFHSCTVALCGIADPNQEGYAYALIGRSNSIDASEADITNGTAMLLNGNRGGVIQVMINAAGRLQSVVPTADAPYHGHLTGIDCGDARAGHIAATISDSIGGAPVMNSSINQTDAAGCNIKCATGSGILTSTANNGRFGTGSGNGWVYTLSGQPIEDNL